MLIGTQELIKQSNGTYRQIDYWTTNGILPTVGDCNPGAGYQRKYDEEIVDKVKVLVSISHVFGTRINLHILKLVFDNFDAGAIGLGEGITINWSM